MQIKKIYGIWITLVQCFFSIFVDKSRLDVWLGMCLSHIRNGNISVDDWRMSSLSLNFRMLCFLFISLPDCSTLEWRTSSGSVGKRIRECYQMHIACYYADRVIHLQEQTISIWYALKTSISAHSNAYAKQGTMHFVIMRLRRMFAVSERHERMLVFTLHRNVLCLCILACLFNSYSAWVFRCTFSTCFRSVHILYAVYPSFFFLHTHPFTCVRWTHCQQWQNENSEISFMCKYTNFKLMYGEKELPHALELLSVFPSFVFLLLLHVVLAASKLCEKRAQNKCVCVCVERKRIASERAYVLSAVSWKWMMGKSE